MKININAHIKLNYKTFILLFVFLIFPATALIMIEPHLCWILYKNSKSMYIKDTFYASKVKGLPKKYIETKNKIIFIKDNGTQISSINKQKDFIISGFDEENGIILYTKTKGIINYFDKYGIKKWEYKTYAYPFVINTNLILLVTGENAGFKIIDKNKNELSDFIATGSIALTFSASYFANYIAIGFSDGTLSFYNKNLKILWTKKFVFDSIYPIIKKTAVSSHGKFIAILSGLENEYIYILNNKGKNIFSYITKENRRRNISMQFSLNEKYLIEESDTGFRLYSIDEKKLILSKKLFPKNSLRQLISLDISHSGDYIITAYKYKGESVIVDLFDKHGTLLYRQFMSIDTLPFVQFSKSSNSFIIETEKGFYAYEI